MEIHQLPSLKLNRIHIIGNPASGKTFLAKILSKKLNIRTYDLDDITFKRKYDVKRSKEERVRLLHKICTKKRWMTEGAYLTWVGEALKESEVIIWLDFPYSLTTFRILRRHLGRKMAGKKESFAELLTLLRYSFYYSYGWINRPYSRLQINDALKHYKRKVILIRNSKELDNLIHTIMAKKTL